MRIVFNFSDLWATVNALGAEKIQYTIQRNNSLSEIQTQLLIGLEIQLKDVENTQGLLSYAGNQILLYIPDQGKNLESVLSGNLEVGRRFHIAFCETLDKMKASGRLERYIATANVSGKFQVCGTDIFENEIKNSDGSPLYTPLYVCRKCLEFLNYKSYKSSNNRRTTMQIRNEFSLSEFFKTYSSCFEHLPSRSTLIYGSGTYTRDWKSISERTREARNWYCDECGVCLKEHPYLLHVHHIDGVKNNNRPSNLRVLCKICHGQQPLHDHLISTRTERKIINQIRRTMGIIQPNWASVMAYADPACLGFLEMAKAKDWYVPEIEFTIPSMVEPVEIAWPNHGIALTLDRTTPQILDWYFYQLSDSQLI